MDIVKNWIIKFLGGITKAQMDEFKDQCASFAQDNLQGKKGEVSPDALYFNPFGNEDLLILRSRIFIFAGTVNSLVVAPWCRDVRASWVRVLGKLKGEGYESKNERKSYSSVSALPRV